MIRKQLITIVALTAMVAMIQTAQASVDLGTTATLSALNGTDTYLTIGDKKFSGFSYLETDLTGFDPTKIDVTASIGSDGVYYLTWGGKVSLASLGVSTADLLLNYVVQATGGMVINKIDQAYTGSVVNGGVLAVDETVATGAFGGPVVGFSHLELADLSDPPAEGNDILNIVPPGSLLYVTKDITLATFAPPGALVTISQVAQSFHQVPEPTTMLAGALLLLPFGASTLRILRKNRTA